MEVGSWALVTLNEGDFLKENFFISEDEIVFGYHFKGCTRRPDCGRRHVVFGPLFLNFGLFLAQVWPTLNEGYLEELELWV